MFRAFCLRLFDIEGNEWSIEGRSGKRGEHDPAEEIPPFTRANPTGAIAAATGSRKVSDTESSLTLPSFLNLDGHPRKRSDSTQITRQSVAMRRLLLSLSCVVFGIVSSRAEDSPILLPGAHAHNDYKHPHPLTDALSHGFQSVEADIFLIEGKLLVAHDRDEVKPANTLQALYLDPLQARAKKHDGKVYADSKEPFYLLIDLKSDGETTYRALHKVLTHYRDMLSEFQDTSLDRKAVTIIVSGNRPAEHLKSLKPRLAGRDGRLGDLATADPHFTPWISDNWRKHFQWKGDGDVPQADRDKLKALITQAHARKLQVRFWAIPDKPEAWQLMREHQVDFINTDQLEKLSAFLRQPEPE